MVARSCIPDKRGPETSGRADGGVYLNATKEDEETLKLAIRFLTVTS